MSDMTLLPTGGFGGEAGAAGLGGAVGGLIGSWFGNGFNGRGGYGGDGAAVAVGANAVLDGINNIQTGVNNLGLQTLQGQNSTNLTVERSAASTFNGITSQNTQNLLASVQGFAGLNTAIVSGTNQTVAAINAADVNALERSYQAQIASERCCCETNLNIERQGNATRDLMRQQFADSQAVLICDMKAQLQEARFALSQANQTAALNCKINQVEQLVNFKLPTPQTPPTGCCGC
ncbi:hypothetical protein H1N92_gp76 [Escherichia phage aaroes]|uniref:Uncharacterized protein n=1 Tax=Escherichia phage aaroes TaxID=2696376 RepID=A0A6B9WNW0_9CAUD|nr:hypothetical protein H1N92_gp76 [Escherichia phage aaroes]QHR65791.1 hypothetical protein aaroes_76 [Escherichia phage aaroes]